MEMIEATNSASTNFWEITMVKAIPGIDNITMLRVSEKLILYQISVSEGNTCDVSLLIEFHVEYKNAATCSETNISDELHFDFDV